VAALYTQVSRLRRILPDPVTIISGRGGYRLDAPSGSIDIDVAISWRAMTNRASTSGRVAAIESILALFTGEPYADLDSVDAWSHREQLASIRLTVVEAYAQELLASGRPDEAVTALRSVVAARPDRESAVALLMETLYRSGRQLEALDACAAARDFLREEFGVDLSPQVAALELSILRHDLPADAMPETSAAQHTSVALRTTSVVGRDHDIDAMVALLERARLLTVLGTAGVGKTTVANQVAARMERDGTRVTIVELADAETDADLPAVVAGKVGVSMSENDTFLDALCAALDGPASLLVLDSCEHHAIATARLIGDLLGRVPRLRIVATSREALRAEGEHRWMLHGLRPAEARALFIDRAIAADPEFDTTADDPRLARICTHLDGVPLALELAASTLSFLDVDALLAGLSDRFTLLSSNHLAAPDRHRNLGAALDWSYSRLSESQQEAFDALGVFAGSFTSTDAQQVVGVDALTFFGPLIDRSMLVRHRQFTPARYELLDTMREYARRHRGEQLANDRARHAAWVLSKSSDVEAHCSGPMELMWFRSTRADMSNIRQAYHWFADADRPTEQLELVASLIMWAWQCDQHEVMGWATDLAGTLPPGDRRCRALHIAINTIALSRTRHHPDPATLMRHALEAAGDATGDAAALACYAAAEVGLFAGEFHAAEEAASRGHALAMHHGDSPSVISIGFFCAVDAAFACIYGDRHDEARRWIDAATDLAARLDSTGAHAWVELLHAELLERSDPTRALPHVERCLALVDQHEHSFLARVAHHVRASLTTTPDDRAGLRSLFLLGSEHGAATLSWTQATAGLRHLANSLDRRADPLPAAAIRGALSTLTMDVAEPSEDDPAAIRNAFDGGVAMSFDEVVQFAIDILRADLGG
jgi:predicted ATPase